MLMTSPVTPLLTLAGDTGNQGTFTRYEYCTAGSNPNNCTSTIQMTGASGACRSFQLDDPQTGQTPSGRMSDIAQTVNWEADPATYVGTTFDVEVTWRVKRSLRSPKGQLLHTLHFDVDDTVEDVSLTFGDGNKRWRPLRQGVRGLLAGARAADGAAAATAASARANEDLSLSLSASAIEASVHLCMYVSVLNEHRNTYCLLSFFLIRIVFFPSS